VSPIEVAGFVTGALCVADSPAAVLYVGFMVLCAIGLRSARAFDPAATVDGLVWTLGDFEDVAREQERRIRTETVPLVVADNDACGSG